MPGSPGSGSNRWLIFVLIAAVLIFFNGYIFSAARAVLGVLTASSPAPVSESVAPPEPTAVPAPTQAPAEPEATLAPAPTEAPVYAQMTIKLWHIWSDQEMTAIYPVLDRYRSSHPGVDIEAQKVDDLRNMLPVASAAGNGPDIVAAGNEIIGSMVNQGVLLPLDEYNIDSIYMSSNYEPATVQAVTWQGQTWGLPQAQNGIGLIYNKDLLSSVYLPTDPLNLEVFLNKAKLYHAARTDQWLFCNPGFGSSDGYHSAPVFFGMGVTSYIDNDGTVRLFTPAAIQAGEWILAAKAVTPANSTYGGCMSGFLDGSVGMLWAGPWALPEVENAGIHYGVLPMGRPFVGTLALMLTQSSKYNGHDAAALDLMLYLNSAEVQKELTLANRTIPTRTALFSDPQLADRPDIAGFGAALRLGVPISPAPFADAQWGPVGNAVNNIWTEAMSPSDALLAAQAAAEQAVAGLK